jgi:hypothetical protein
MNSKVRIVEFHWSVATKLKDGRVDQTLVIRGDAGGVEEAVKRIQAMASFAMDLGPPRR